jgi:hypothetical protein
MQLRIEIEEDSIYAESDQEDEQTHSVIAGARTGRPFVNEPEMEEGKEDNVPTKRALFRKLKKHFATGQHKKLMLTINGIKMTTNTNALNKGLT